MMEIEAGLLTLLKPVSAEVIAASGRSHLRVEGDQLRWDGKSAPAFALDGDFTLASPGAPSRALRGKLRVHASGGLLQLRLTASVEDLAAAVAAAESPAAAFDAALRAQAILARSWLVAAGRRHPEFPVCDTTHCQHFKGLEQRGEQAARATRGLVLHWQGSPFAPAYSASCGGRTAVPAAIAWPKAAYPYASVRCAECERNAPRWTRRFRDADATALRQHPHSEPVRLAICRRDGWDALPGNAYGMRDSGEDLILEGRGQGHGAGYCQRGGAALARQGLNAAAILRHYFPGATIAPLQ